MKIPVKIPLEKTFCLPEGNYRGKLVRVASSYKTPVKGIDQQVRFLYQVYIPSLKNKLPMAGRNFALDMDPGSDLRNYLELWLGKSFIKQHSGETLDLDSLVGLEGDLTLIHVHNDGYPEPLVFIQAAFPVGHLHLDEQPLDVTKG